MEHLRALETLLMELRTASFKAALGHQEAQYLRFMLRDGQIKPLLDKVRALKDYPLPHTKRQIQAFLGLANYYWHLVPMFLEITAPLYELTRTAALNKIWLTKGDQESIL